ncbi:unnamed protein product [Parnassius apollo]|uniref:(apollo) hypothetical protein n=1 Tax=Parnassius apollo TaxID=110799 RepID=A0A8S3Y628_PARAO|nr:unnamed protein product [Parnassius apollo]
MAPSNGCWFFKLCILITSSVLSRAYDVKNHPCCQEPGENLTLSMIIDAYEIYGHDPTDKLDHLAHYQIEMMKVKRAPDQYIINEHIHIATDHLARFIKLHIKELKHIRDVSTMPKAIVKCGTDMYKLPPLTAASCIITSGSFILDFNIQGIRFRHFDYLLILPNGHTYYTKEKFSPLVCDHHVCEWNNTNFYGGPFIIPGDPGTGLSPIPPFLEQTTEFTTVSTENPSEFNPNITYTLDGCWFMFPPNYGSIAGISYLDPLSVNEYRYTCQGSGNNKGLYWYPQWMGAPPHHPYPQSGDIPVDIPQGLPGPYYPNLQGDVPIGANTNLGA